MSDDSADDGGGGDNSGFFGWFWNAVLSFFGGGDSSDSGSTDTASNSGSTDTASNAGQQTGTASDGQTETTTGEPLEENDGETTVAPAPVNVTTTEAPSEGEDDSPILPPGHERGVWYQRIGGEWTRTDATDARDLGLGEFAMGDGDGVTHLHYAGGPPQPPNDPRMSGFTEVRQQNSQDVQDIPGGTPNPNTWVYIYDSIEDLPAFLQPPAGFEGDGWLVPSTDGGPSYTVYLQPDGTVIVWRTGH